METFSALLIFCAGNSPVTGEFPSQRSVTRSFDVFFNLCPNKRLGQQSRGWWFETPSCPLWDHCNGNGRHAGCFISTEGHPFHDLWILLLPIKQTIARFKWYILSIPVKVTQWHKSNPEGFGKMDRMVPQKLGKFCPLGLSNITFPSTKYANITAHTINTLGEKWGIEHVEIASHINRWLWIPKILKQGGDYTRNIIRTAVEFCHTKWLST